MSGYASDSATSSYCLGNGKKPNLISTRIFEIETGFNIYEGRERQNSSSLARYKSSESFAALLTTGRYADQRPAEVVDWAGDTAALEAVQP